MDEIIKCRACGYTYNRQEEEAKEQWKRRPEFMTARDSVEVYDDFHRRWVERAVLICPECKTLRME